MWQKTSRLSVVGPGIALLPMALLFVVVSPFSGGLSTRWGAPVTTAGGVAVIGCGLVLIGLCAQQASLVPVEIGLALTGLGMGPATGPRMAGATVGAGRLLSAAHRAPG